jgi:hypothetical protein
MLAFLSRMLHKLGVHAARARATPNAIDPHRDESAFVSLCAAQATRASSLARYPPSPLPLQISYWVLWLAGLASAYESPKPLSALGVDENGVFRPTEKRALVVGCDDYVDAPRLTGAVRDARAIAGALSNLNFAVTCLESPSVAELSVALASLGTSRQDGGLAVFFFAGHGQEVVLQVSCLVPSPSPRAFMSSCCVVL